MTTVTVLKIASGTVQVERHVTRPATGLWNRIRRRRQITDVRIVGVYVNAVQRFEIASHMNAPGTLDVVLRGRTFESLLTRLVDTTGEGEMVEAPRLRCGCGPRAPGTCEDCVAEAEDHPFG